MEVFTDAWGGGGGDMLIREEGRGSTSVHRHHTLVMILPGKVPLAVPLLHIHYATTAATTPLPLPLL
jgi:hypothetical protein